MNIDELWNNWWDTRTSTQELMSKEAFTKAIAEIISSESLPADLLVRQGVPQPVFACGAMLQKNEKVKLATGYRFADSENEAKGMFLTTIRSNPEYDSYSILDINCTKIEMPASKSA